MLEFGYSKLKIVNIQDVLPWTYLYFSCYQLETTYII